MRNIVRLAGDFLGLWRVCGATIATKWMWYVACNAPSIFVRKTFSVADLAMGQGPFHVKVKKYGVSFSVMSEDAIGGIREMYVRDCYLGGLLEIRDGDTVVDLGANVGNFTNLALAHGSNVRVVAVEPSAALNEVFNQSVGLNKGYLERTDLIRGFVGKMSGLQKQLLNSDPNYADAIWISEEQLIQEGNLSEIDYLKCDIEGGEFGLLTQTSKLCAMTKSLAVELHPKAGDVEQLLEDLDSLGFTKLRIQWDSDGGCTVLAKRK